MNDIKPCPNCETVADHGLIVNVCHSHNMRNYISCNWCGFCGPKAHPNEGKEGAISSWNSLPRRDVPQPIETAPKDCWILVCRANFSTWTNAIIHKEGTMTPLPWEPTHWLPMPSLPETQTKQ